MTTNKLGRGSKVKVKIDGEWHDGIVLGIFQDEVRVRLHNYKSYWFNEMSPNIKCLTES